jgi:hypothetical protein
VIRQTEFCHAANKLHLEIQTAHRALIERSFYVAEC